MIKVLIKIIYSFNIRNSRRSNKNLKAAPKLTDAAIPNVKVLPKGILK